MKKLILHLMCFIISIFVIVFYITFRLSDNFEVYKISKLDGLITELIGGLIFIFLLILILKPSLNICAHIAEIPEGNGNKRHLRFKIVNTSLFRAYDLQIRIFHRERTHASGPDITSDLVASFEGYQVGIAYLESAFRSLISETKTNAAQFRFFKVVNQDMTDDKVKAILDSGNSFLEIHVYLRNGLSGLQGNFVRKFNNLSCIKPGFYKHGFPTDIAN